jgi:outer membrane protein OmpA-like peptidoglycan-associated protein
MPDARTRTALRTSRTALITVGLIALILGCRPPPPTPVYYEDDRGRDSDFDGVADQDDPCPAEPEDGLPPRANDGCPADDPDRDGIGRAYDLCPEAKEDGLPPAPADGCPASDSDGDGVADVHDRCPGLREDNLDPDPNDGCPSPDRDRDGIADVRDRCPDQPETYNGFEDDDGCPDEAPRTTVAATYDPTNLTVYVDPTAGYGFEFPTGSMALTPKGQATAAEVAKLLNKHPEWERIEIEGHASSKGDDRANVTLTLERARAVARALIGNGVAAKRLVPIGYGEYCPKIDRGDEVDEPVNRRVELKIVRISGRWQEQPRGCWRATRAGIDPAKASVGVPPSAPAVIDTHGGGV